MSKTLDYYNKNAKQFADETFDADIATIRDRFTDKLSSSDLREAIILDWGCGSGRDALAFKEAGFIVEATDASYELCKIASEKTGIAVRCERFDELKCVEKYDGIWACASLLHVAKKDLPGVISIAKSALKRTGVLYASFKYGIFEGEHKEREFTFLTEDSLTDIIKEVDAVEIIDLWKSTDVRRGVDVDWLNVMIRKM
ncbi:MAG: class I SAM-dependent methyltransferase [Lachnospiraceae bacterium]|nr:class I SAM-dependent methyltransferase [Lachnospiraceae bacterium]